MKISEKHNKEDQSASFLQYSGLAFEMLAFILLGVFGGVKLDEYMQSEKPVFTIIGSLLGCIFSMVIIVLKLTKNK